MSDFKRLWKETEEFVHSHEKDIAKKYREAIKRRVGNSTMKVKERDEKSRIE